MSIRRYSCRSGTASAAAASKFGGGGAGGVAADARPRKIPSMLGAFMRSSYRRLALALASILPIVAAACASRPPSPAASGPTDGEFVGFITDTECGPDHSAMMKKGGTKTAPECTRKCVSEGSTYAFIEADSKRFYQLDDQDAPAAYAGQKVRIRGRRQGDTILVQSVAPAD